MNIPSHYKVRYSSFRSPGIYILYFLLKVTSAFFVGITAALVFYKILGYSTFGFVFVGVVFSGLTLKLIGQAGLIKVLVFDLAFVFFLLVLKMYIHLAPNA